MLRFILCKKKLGLNNISMAIVLWKSFYYITHYQNVASIVQHGLLSKNHVKKSRIEVIDIANKEVQGRRTRIEPIYKRSIHDYVPLYINPKNAMLSAIRHLTNELVILKIEPAVLENRKHLYTDGNAASSITLFSESRSVVDSSIPVLLADCWSAHEDGKRRRCAEVLIYGSIDAKHIAGAVCSSANVLAHLRKACPGSVEIDNSFFY